MNQITQGYFDESGDVGTGSDFYVVSMVVFDSQEAARKTKSILKREKKNNKRFNLDEFKFHLLHTGNSHHRNSLQRVLKKLSKCDFRVYAYVVQKPEKHRFAFDIAKRRLVLELFQRLCDKEQTSRIIDLRSDNNFFGTSKTDHTRMLFCKVRDGQDKQYYLEHELTYEQYKEFVQPDQEMIQEVLKGRNCCLTDWKVFTIKSKDSKTEQGIQIADLIAGSIFQKYNSNNPEYFNLIKDKIAYLQE